MLLRIFIGEGDEFKGAPLYEKIVLRAREQKLAGATVLRGPMGFGKSSHLHTAKILRLSLDLPMVIEIVDSEEKIREFLPILDGMIEGGLVTLEACKRLCIEVNTPTLRTSDARSSGLSATKVLKLKSCYSSYFGPHGRARLPSNVRLLSTHVRNYGDVFRQAAGASRLTAILARRA